jgi:hypothetical protein
MSALQRIKQSPNPDKPEKSKRTAKRAKNAKKIFLNLAHLAAFAVRKFLHKKQGFNFKGNNVLLMQLNLK